MLNNHTSILKDFSKVLPMMTTEENKMALECAERVKSHLERAFARTGDERFARNIAVVNNIIAEHRRVLIKGPSSRNWNLGVAS